MSDMIDDKRNAAPSTLSRRAFAAISAVEGLKLTDAGKRRIADMDARGLSPSERRAEILRAYKGSKRK